MYRLLQASFRHGQSNLAFEGRVRVPIPDTALTSRVTDTRRRVRWDGSAEVEAAQAQCSGPASSTWELGRGRNDPSLSFPGCNSQGVGDLTGVTPTQPSHGAVSTRRA